MADEPLTIRTAGRVQPTCPRCGSAMIVIGRLLDAAGSPVGFGATDADGRARPMGIIKSCYCNDCGEVALTLD